MLNIVIFGPPGAGKGTQAIKLSEKYNLIHLSTGEVIRAEIKKGSDLGMEAAEQMQGGKLASDELVLGIIQKFVGEHKDTPGVIYDGFPRTLPQAEAFEKMLEDHGESVSAMLALDVPDEELIKRILERGKISGREDDQSEQVIRNRIEVYNRQTAPLIAYYDQRGKYFPIPGDGGIELVFDRICAIVDGIPG